MRTSKAFQFTVNPQNEADLARLNELKAWIKAFNKLGLVKYLRSGLTVPNRYRVCCKARLGKASPYADLYKNRGIFTVAKAHASHFDIYVIER